MTRVSIRSWTGVSERRYDGTAVGWMPNVEAKAAFLAGCAASTWICFSTSQLATFLVPAYSSGEDPLTLRVAVLGDAVLSAVALGDGGGLSGGGVACLAAVDSVKGSGPDAAAGCRNTSLAAVVEVPPPPGRVSTTATATTAARATMAVASRGRDFHQGPRGGGPAAPPPPALPGGTGGAGGGGGGGPSRPPERGPEGGPVGRSDDGGTDDDGGCVRGLDEGWGGGWPEGCVVTGSSFQAEEFRSHMDAFRYSCTEISGFLRVWCTPGCHCVLRPGGGRKPRVPTVAG